MTQSSRPRRPPYTRSSMADDHPTTVPTYKRLPLPAPLPDAGATTADGARWRRPATPPGLRGPRPPPRPGAALRRPPRREAAAAKRRVTSGRVVKWSGARSSAGSLLSLVLFLVSRADPASKISDAGKAPAQRRRLPADHARTRSSCSAPTRAPKGSHEPGATTSARAARALGHDHAAAHRRRRQRARCRSPATRVVDIPGHGHDKINAAYAYRRAGARDQDRQAVPRHPRSTTSSRSTSRTSRSSIDSLGGINYTGGCVQLAASTAARPTAATRCGSSAARTTSTASRRSRSPARARTSAARARTTSTARGASRRSSPR